MTNSTHGFNWKRAIGATLLVGAAACLAIFSPWAKITLAKTRAERIDKAYSDGLIICEAYDSELDAIIQKYLPEDAIFGIDQSPAFTHQINALRLAGRNLYYLELSIEPDSRARNPPVFIVRGTPTVLRAQISPGTSEELGKLLDGDIQHARHEQPVVIDGTGYGFRDFGRPGGCAWTNSPKANSRADKLIHIFHSLVKHAKANGTIDSATDRELLLAIRAMRVE